MFTRGIKRKCNQEDDIEGPLTVPYTVERQSLLNMSLVKLQLCHMLVEPNLCRSVLIANTVRQIQEEMTQDGTWQILRDQAIEEAPIDRLLSTDILCRSSKDQDGVKSCNDSYITYSDDLEVHQVEEVSDLSTLTSLKLQNAQPHLWEVDSQQEKVHLQKSLEHIFETLENRNTNTVEDLFPEVDASYYDLDTVLTGVMGNSKLNHSDMLENFSQTTKSASCKTEISEMDHIVEILVES